MDPPINLPSLVEDLEVNIDELSCALQPLLSSTLPSRASTLPLLDKAKLYVLAAYSIESLLFSSIQASGINAKEHAVFHELARLKGYFGKIKEAEHEPEKPKTRLDTAAAARFIRHGLAGNDRYDLERQEQAAKERARAVLKANRPHLKFGEGEGDEAATFGPEATVQQSKKRAVDGAEVACTKSTDANTFGHAQELGEDQNVERPVSEEPKKKKAKLSTPDALEPNSSKLHSATIPSRSKSKSNSNSLGGQQSQADENKGSSALLGNSESPPTTKAARKAARRARKEAKRIRKDKNEALLTGLEDDNMLASKANKNSGVSTRGAQPSSHSETFKALLDGSWSDAKAKAAETKTKGKGKEK